MKPKTIIISILILLFASCGPTKEQEIMFKEKINYYAPTHTQKNNFREIYHAEAVKLQTKAKAYLEKQSRKMVETQNDIFGIGSSIDELDDMISMFSGGYGETRVGRTEKWLRWCNGQTDLMVEQMTELFDSLMTAKSLPDSHDKVIGNDDLIKNIYQSPNKYKANKSNREKTVIKWKTQK